MALAAVTTVDNTAGEINIAIAACVAYDQAAYTAVLNFCNAVTTILSSPNPVFPNYQERESTLNAAFVALKAAVNV